MAGFLTDEMKGFIVSVALRRNQLPNHPGIGITGVLYSSIRRGGCVRSSTRQLYSPIQKGAKVKSIRLVSGDHEVDCKMDAGSFMLKAAYLKKV